MFSLKLKNIYSMLYNKTSNLEFFIEINYLNWRTND